MAKTLSFQDTKPMHLQTERSPSPHGQWRPWRRWFAKDLGSLSPAARTQFEDPKDDLGKKRAKKAIPSLPRPGTFRRQQSELRENLEPINIQERRALSVDPRQGDSFRGSSRISVPSLPRTSAPGLLGTADSTAVTQQDPETIAEAAEPEPVVEDIAERPPLYNDVFDDDLEDELEKRWILNLSMHFRDRSNREKFFVTFAETPTHWRRVTVSVDYRDAPPNSLELELQHTQYQRDKSAKIYEAIRDSLLDIQFYETVTNLKLATENERLHVHVTEDINEVIHFPPAHSIGHLQHCMKVKEKDVEFDSHLSGFVYKVNVNGHVFIKKEIPGPDTVEEFLYEVNALHRLSDSDSVIHFGGVITDNEGRHLKGLLISYAEKGALVDVLYDGRGELPWPQRERWAKQIVQGLSEIHEAGFVQGDFTLSNIVIDGDDKAKIIDINRRGCPVGWEPPEVAALIESKQRIAMYIGVKSDIFQLGMVLWAIAMQQDEPDIQPRPLTLHSAPDEIPSYYRKLVHTCLSDDPKDRRNTSYLLHMFSELADVPPMAPEDRELDGGEHQYIDPATAVNREDIERFRRLASPVTEHANLDIISAGSHTYVNPPTDISGEAYFFPTRGRSPTRLPVEATEHRHSSHVSPLDMSRQADEDDLASPEGEPIVVDVSPERHYLSREEPSTIDVAYAEPERPSTRKATMEDDDVSIDLNDAARASPEEYRLRHEELMEDIGYPELLTSQVYQSPVEHISHNGSHTGDCAYATPPQSQAADVFHSHDSFADMGETTYFDPLEATDDRQGSAGPGLLTPAPWEEQEFISPQTSMSEQTLILEDRPQIEHRHEDNNLQFTDVSNKEPDSPQPAIVPAADEAEATPNLRESVGEVDKPPTASEGASTLTAASLDGTLHDNYGETLSSGWIEEVTPENMDMKLEHPPTDEVVPSSPHNHVADTAPEPTKPSQDAAVDSPVDPVAEQLQSSSGRSSLDKAAPETTFLAVETDDGNFKHVENRTDSGFASHYDPNSPTSRRVYGLDSPLATSEKCCRT